MIRPSPAPSPPSFGLVTPVRQRLFDISRMNDMHLEDIEKKRIESITHSQVFRVEYQQKVECILITTSDTVFSFEKLVRHAQMQTT